MTTKTATRTAKAAKTAKIDAAVLAKPLSAEEAAKLLKLATKAKSIELKVSMPLVSQRAAYQALGFDAAEAQPRTAYFFDTPDLALNRAGMAVRARRIQGGTADTVVKIRPVDPARLDKKLRALEEFKIEVDAMPGGFVCSASFKGVCDSQAVLDVEAGATPLRKLFSKEQRAFYDAHAPAGLTMDKLVVLGPTLLLKVRHDPKDFDRRLVLELWLYPDGSRTMEISTKCLPEEAFQVAAEFKAYLAGKGIALGKDQSAKTRTTLEFYSAMLKREGLTA
jgi:hypothetical protein